MSINDRIKLHFEHCTQQDFFYNANLAFMIRNALRCENLTLTEMRGQNFFQN